MSFENEQPLKEPGGYWIIWAIPLVFIFICLCLVLNGNLEMSIFNSNIQTTSLPTPDCEPHTQVLNQGESYSFEIPNNNCAKIQDILYIKNYSGNPVFNKIEDFRSTGDPLVWESKDYRVQVSQPDFSQPTLKVVVTKK